MRAGRSHRIGQQPAAGRGLNERGRRKRPRLTRRKHTTAPARQAVATSLQAIGVALRGPIPHMPQEEAFSDSVPDMVEAPGPVAVDASAALAARHPHLHVVEVLAVRHWTSSYFSLTTTRPVDLRFDSGQFLMLGMEVQGRPLLRAYSVASPAWAEQLEFFSIKVADGALTSRLQHARPGDRLLLSRKPTGTLLITDLHPGRLLYLLATGTGLAPFLAVATELATWERFEQVVVAHGVRTAEDLAYRDYLEHELAAHEFLGPLLRDRLHYYPVVSRETFVHQGRVTTLFGNGRMAADLGLPAPDPTSDRVMLCGSPAMLTEGTALLDGMGFVASPRIGQAGSYVIERAFVER